MASLLALSPVSLSVGAAQSEEPLLISANPMSEKTDGEPTAEALESIIKTVKPRLSVPENCTEFHFDYNGKNPYSDAAWSLSWSDPDSGMSVGVSCDENGNLIRYNAYNPDENEKTAVFPEQPKEAYIETAKAFLSRTAPDAHLTLAESYDANGLYRPTYRYRFVRTENGLEVPSQYAYVEVNALTGAVTGCSVEYRYDTVINALQNPITAEKAKEFLHGQLKMELNYVANRTYDEDGTAREKAVQSAAISSLAP